MKSVFLQQGKKNLLIIKKLLSVEAKIIICEQKMLKVVNEKLFQMFIIISVVVCYMIKNFMVVSPNFFPFLSFYKLSDFFSRDFFVRNLGENLFLIKLEIF